MNTTTLTYVLYFITAWFVLGYIARGIIRYNTERYNGWRTTRTLRWQRQAFLRGPIGLYQVLRRKFRCGIDSCMYLRISFRQQSNQFAKLSGLIEIALVVTWIFFLGEHGYIWAGIVLTPVFVWELMVALGLTSEHHGVPNRRQT